MKVLTAIVLVSTFMLPLRAEASWFEFCRMEGVVESVMPTIDGNQRSFDFRVVVSAARRDETAALESYTDCAQYVGSPVELTLVLPRHDQPAAGDRIVFTRSLVNGFSDPETSEVASSVQVKLLAYHRAGRH